MRTRASGIGVALATLLAWTPVSSTLAHADEGDAEAQFNYGLSEMMAGRYVSGCAALSGSFRLDPRPGTLFTLAECERKWGRTASALAGYQEYLALYSRMSPDQAAKQGERAHIAAEARSGLEASVPRLAVRLPEGAPPDAVVERDDVLLAGPMLGAAIPVDPGEHVVRVKMPDGQTSELKVTLVDGETRVVALALPAAPPVPPTAPAAARPDVVPAQPGGSHRPWTFVALGVGGAGIATAAVTGVLALGKKSTASSECSSMGVCTSQDGVDAGNAARSLANAETVALVVGGVALAAAVVLWLTEPKSPRSSVQAWLGACPGYTGPTW